MHPVRLIGRSLQAIEGGLRRLGADGYGGGIALFLLLAIIWVAGVSGVVMALSTLGSWSGWAAHVFVLYSFLALGDLLRHGRDIERAVARGALDDARRNVSKLVGRDTDPMDGAACRRAAVESLSENLTDGFTSALFWYVDRRAAAAHAVQGREHDGFDGRIQDAALPPVRLVRRQAGRCDELRAGAS